MYEAAAHNIVQSCGDDCLKPVPSVFESDDFKILHVVVKKRRKFFFLSAKYSATPFTLQDLLVKPSPDLEPATSKAIFLKDFRKQYKLSLKGNTGAKLKAMFEVELGGKDDVEVDCNLGDLERETVDVQKLLDLLKGRKINLDHDFVKQVRKNSRKSLCIVVGNVSLTTDCIIETKIAREGDEKISLDKLKIMTVDECSSVVSNRDKSFLLLAGTTLAYEAYELTVRTSGTMEVIVDRDVLGGFASIDLVDSVTKLAVHEDDDDDDIFAPITRADRSVRILVRRAVLDICAEPLAFTRLCHIFAEAKRCIKNNEKLFTTLGILKTVVHVGFDSWVDLLRFADFKIEDDRVTYPNKKTAEFKAVYGVLKCLRVETDDTLLVLFSQLTNNLAGALCHVLYNAINNKATDLADKSVKAIYDCDNSAQNLLSHLGFYITEEAYLNPPKTGPTRVDALYRVVAALFDCKC